MPQMSSRRRPMLAAPSLPMPNKTDKPLALPTPAPALRRSPRKQKITSQSSVLDSVPVPVLDFASSQQRSSPQKQVSGRRSPLKQTQAKAREATKDALDNAPRLEPVPPKKQFQSLTQDFIVIEDDSEDVLAEELHQPLPALAAPKLTSHDINSDQENMGIQGRVRKQQQPTSAMSRITQAARKQTEKSKSRTASRKDAPKSSNPYVLTQAHCDDDLVDGSGAEEEEEEEDTDLSGFIVDDDAEISFHQSEGAQSSEESEPEAKPRRRPKQTLQHAEPAARRRLVRGRNKRLADSDDSDDMDLSKALDSMKLGGEKLEQEKNAARRKTIEVVDLTSSPAPESRDDGSSRDGQSSRDSMSTLLDPLATFHPALQLQPSIKNTLQLLPSKIGPLTASSVRSTTSSTEIEHPTTPPATPPRSPSKLKSPTKLRSPSKSHLSPAKQHKAPRQSTDAFWDHEVVNEWTETYSPKKAPLVSPRKNLLERFNLFIDDGLDCLSDDEDQEASNSSQDPFNESSDSLPSPCASPTKSRSPSKSASVRNDLARAREEKKAKLVAKKKFDSEKHQMAVDLLMALDANITSSKISSLSHSTGGMQLIWSKTLRSTAGRANWKRTVTKPSGSPIKGGDSSSLDAVSSQPGIMIQHFASIELAEKIIDRPERLVNTLAHEFCHLANFMVSGIRDQPHGASFQQWGRKVTSWLKSAGATHTEGWRPEWKAVEVTTKHSYVVETKYLWLCTGRPKDKMGLAAQMLELEGEEGCGAEYGRHSKSIDVEKQRCGVCKGFLVQVRPAPRPVSPRKNSPVKSNGGLRTLREESSGDGVRNLQKLLESVDLSDL